MMNLLPPQQKKELFWEERYKLFLISAVSAVVFLAALFLVLLAVKIYISGQVRGNDIIAAAMPAEQEKEIVEINESLENLASFYEKQPDVAGFLEKISKIIPKNTGLTSIFLNFSQKDNNFSVSLQGLSPTREALLQLKQNLESEAGLKDVNFPAANWVKPENIEFSVGLKADMFNVKR